MLDPVSAQVNVLLFSVLRECVGSGQVSISINRSESAGEFLERLAELYPDIRPLLASTRVAVNQEYVSREYPVRAGDEVALITPVSGG